MSACVASDFDFLLEENDKRPTKRPKTLISEYIEGKRILPPGTPFQGFWENSKTPYSVEIMDNMAPSSPVQHQAIMKAGQLGLTAAAENVIAYWMDEFPAEILYISATDDALKKWGPKHLEPLIDSCGFRHKIASQSTARSNRRTGDTMFAKEYAGGALNMASAQSPSSLRSESKRVLVRDEIDGAPAMLRTGEGSFLSVSYVRTNAWGDRRKVMDYSTPVTMEESQIYKLYVAGDQRVYLVPCPMCGKFQELKFGNEQTQYGIKAETKAGVLDRAYYVCEHCHEAIFNNFKTKMLNAGYWEPTATSHSKYYRSYHISSLYSPIGMMSWFELYQEFLKAKEEQDGMRSFQTLYLGLPFKESGTKPKLEHLIELRGDYRSGTVPDGVLFLTAAADVQRGSQRDEKNPPRIEMEVCGHGAGYRTWSIDYRRFEGSTDDPMSGAWEDLAEFVNGGGLIYERKDRFQFQVQLMFIDSGDGPFADVVYRFCLGTGWGACYPSKGFGWINPKKSRKEGDVVSRANFKRYKAAQLGPTTLYEISTNHYKGIVYRNVGIKRVEIDPQKPGFCEFPIDYGEKYFNMLRGQDRRNDGSFHKTTRRDEALDCRAYNLCAHDVYLDAKIYELKKAFEKKGATPAQLQEINSKKVLEILTEQTRRMVGAEKGRDA